MVHRYYGFLLAFLVNSKTVFLCKCQSQFFVWDFENITVFLKQLLSPTFEKNQVRTKIW